MTTKIRRWIETDTGHRVPNHKSKCRNIHGHRYRWEVELEGTTVTAKGTSDEGMLMDFSDVKSILMEYIHDVVDHAFLVYEGDKEVIDALSMIENQKIVQLPFIPTAENLAKWAYYTVEPHMKSAYGNQIRVRCFHVRETPKSWASFEPR